MSDQLPEEKAEKSERRSLHRWLRRLGVAGFLFFLVKGLLWLTIPAVLLIINCPAGE